MSNLSKAQEYGRLALKNLEDDARPEIIMVGVLETCMEYLAAILDELEAMRKEEERRRRWMN